MRPKLMVLGQVVLQKTVEVCLPPGLKQPSPITLLSSKRRYQHQHSCFTISKCEGAAGPLSSAASSQPLSELPGRKHGGPARREQLEARRTRKSGRDWQDSHAPSQQPWPTSSRSPRRRYRRRNSPGPTLERTGPPSRARRKYEKTAVRHFPRVAPPLPSQTDAGASLNKAWVGAIRSDRRRPGRRAVSVASAIPIINSPPPVPRRISERGRYSRADDRARGSSGAALGE
jgi:hypothetical protein